MEKKQNELKPIGDLLPKLLKEYKLDIPLKIMKLKTEWPQVVGEKIASFSYVQHYNQSILYIGVLNSVWMQHLFIQKKSLILKINDFLGGTFVYDLCFKRSGIKKNISSSTIQPVEEDKKMEYDSSIKDYVLSSQTIAKIKKDTETIISPLRKQWRNILVLQEKKKQVLLQEGKKTCPICGNWLENKEKICLLCQLKKRIEYKSEIRQCLQLMPWLSLDEFVEQGHIPKGCENYIELYREVRRDCIYHYMEKIYLNVDTLEDNMMLALFITQSKPYEITDEFIERLTKKYHMRNNKNKNKKKR